MQGRDVGIVAVIVLAVVLVVGLLGSGVMGAGMMGGGMMGPGDGGLFGAGMLFMVLFWALVIGGVALLVVWLVRQTEPAGGRAAGGEGGAIGLLKERYARGEITREQYEQMKRDLQ